ncbi:hypothetical protein PoB_000288000 [Plakobranchus ocellatus]|uniref:Uncharacterized protein n=1 Tax=Plakobranchus ocellatus TaxID=259542 RepID=A0AAV3Y0Z4_9GAST|nr:hypothetical protein PoB_000288000 [Plakobranchus ocellatus]
MSPTDRNQPGPDILILHVSDGSTVGETIAGRFRGDSFNLQVELCPLNKTLMLHSGSTQLLSPLRPLVSLPGSAPVHLNHEIVKSIHRMQDWPSPSSPSSSSSSSISSLSPTWSVSKQQSPILSSALPAPCQEFNLPTEPMAKMMKKQSTEREPLANVRCGQQRTLSVLLVTPGMLKHLNTISEASRNILIELLKGRPNPVALQCFVSESELENHLEKAFGNSAFRWRHLEVGESRESFQSCMIGLMAFLEEERDMLPIPSLKRCFLFPEKPVLPGDPLYILLDSRLPESVDTSALELRISGFNDAMIARRVSELLFEFQAPGKQITKYEWADDAMSSRSE